MLAIVEIFDGDHRRALYYVVISGIFDFLDGFVARMLRVKSELGGQLDSLADMISFSAVPALFLYQHLQSLEYTHLSYAALLIAAFSALRLAKFNIDDSQSEVFKGLPTPANAIMVTALIYVQIDQSWLWMTIVVVSCILLVAPMPMLALKFSSFGLRPNIWRYLLIAASITTLALLGLPGVVFIIPMYVFLSILANFVG